MSSPAGAASVQNVFAPDTTAGFTQRLPPHGSVPRLHIVKDIRGGGDPLDDVCGTPSTEGPRHPGGGQARQRLCPAQPDPPDVASRCTVRPFGPRGRLHRCCRRRGRTRCAPCSWPKSRPRDVRWWPRDRPRDHVARGAQHRRGRGRGPVRHVYHQPTRHPAPRTRRTS